MEINQISITCNDFVGGRHGSSSFEMWCGIEIFGDVFLELN